MAAIRTAPVRLLLAAVITVLLSLWIGSQHPAYAANFIVDSTADAVDANPGDGICDDGAGNCTLRAAIQETNALPGADTITLPPGTYTLSIEGPGESLAATGDLDITDGLSILGAGKETTTIDGGGIDRVFHIYRAATTIHILGVAIQNGRLLPDVGGAGILSWSSNLTLTDSIVRDNAASDIAAGGGIFNAAGIMEITNTSITGNTAKEGGGIANGLGGTAIIVDSTITGNVAEGDVVPNIGGGIENFGSGTLKLIDSTVSGNTATYWGGGIANLDSTMEISNSTISGNTAGVDGGGIFNFGDTAEISDSLLSGNTAGEDGGGIFNSETGTMTLAGVVVTGNQAQEGGGGGIFNGRFGRGAMVVTNSTVSNNTSRTSGGGIHNLGILSLDDGAIEHNDGGVTGGGIFNQAIVTITDSAVTDNVTSSTGGGIDSGGTATIIDSTISHNFAGHGAGGGGGVNNFGTMEISNSNVNDNSSHDWGGGVSNSGELALTNTTLSGNAAGTEGGGLRNHPLGTSTLTNVTISDNTAATGGGIFSLADPFAFGGSVALKNSLLAHNTSFNCSGGDPIISHGHNLDSGNTCNFAGPGDLSSTDPLLGPLADNGGPTETHALLVGSPAIDAGSDDCPPPATDQRGLPRPTDGDADGTYACDIGAYEVACAGDLNRDGTVDGRDVRVVARALFSRPGQMRWDTTADINTDGRVDLQDLFIVLRPPRDAACHLASS
jgi:CSLREA domain-containing protein